MKIYPVNQQWFKEDTLRRIQKYAKIKYNAPQINIIRRPVADLANSKSTTTTTSADSKF
jgi:hypothetical protein